MTQEEFLSTSFGAGMKAKYMGGEYPIISFDTTERLIGLGGGIMERIKWVRCENVEIIK
jgi:hypothetical protein